MSEQLKRILAIAVLATIGVAVCWGVFFVAAYWGFEAETIRYETFIGAVAFVSLALGGIWTAETLWERMP